MKHLYLLKFYMKCLLSAKTELKYNKIEIKDSDRNEINIVDRY